MSNKKVIIKADEKWRITFHKKTGINKGTVLFIVPVFRKTKLTKVVEALIDKLKEYTEKE